MMDSIRVLFWCMRNPREMWTWMFTAWAVENYYANAEKAMVLALKRRRAKDPNYN